MNDEGTEGTSDEAQLRKDTAYSPASERETHVKQEDQSTAASAIDEDAVDLLPGTGGQDDQGDIDVDPDEVDIPRDEGPSTRPV